MSLRIIWKAKATEEIISNISEKLIVIEEFSVVNKYKPIKHIPTANHIDQCIIFLKNIFKIIGTIGTYNAVIKAALETSLFNKAICWIVAPKPKAKLVKKINKKVLGFEIVLM